MHKTEGQARENVLFCEKTIGAKEKNKMVVNGRLFGPPFPASFSYFSPLLPLSFLPPSLLLASSSPSLSLSFPLALSH